MTRPFILLALCVSPAFAQGWTQLTNTRMHNATGAMSVCPPDNFQPAGGGIPAYSFNGLCFGKITDQSSAAIDTKRSRMVIWGGGHLGYRGNEAYSVDLVTPSATSATCGITGASCVISSNVSAPTMTRLNNPSAWQSDCSDEADGSLQAEHTWGAFLYLPKHDKFFMWLGGHYCGSGYGPWLDTRAWLMDPITAAWTKKADASPAWGGGNGGFSAGAHCVIDPTTAHETVLCLADSKAIYRYDVDDNVWSTVIAYNTLPFVGSTVQTGPKLVVDPDRKLLFFIGSSFTAPVSPDPRIYSLSLVDWSGVDWTANVTGCGDLMGYAYPSAVWDPSIHKIVGYVPRTVASSSPSNQVIIFDPATSTCVAQPFTGGPTAHDAILARNGSTSEHGMYGRFGYVPNLGKYVLLNNPDEDAYTFTLNLTATHGLGASTLTCVDRDGDGYGTGPGCSGSDADDQDAAVHTSAQFLSKWTDIPTGLRHLGYNPANIWYVSPSGNDATGVVNNTSQPFATCCGSGKANPVAGDAVMLRGGTYAFWTVWAPSGTAGAPTLYLAYPGELPHFTPYPAGFDFTNISWAIIDGLKFTASGSNACINLAAASNVIVRHVDASGCTWGIDTELPVDVTVEDSALHGNGEHGIYFTNHPAPGSGAFTYGKIFARRNLLYSNDRTGIQMNGPFRYSVIEQNISYGNGYPGGSGAGFSWLTGVRDSVLRDNVSINNPQGLVISQYQAFCEVYPHTPCPFPQTGNIIENFTSYVTGTYSDGTVMGGSQTVVQVGSAVSDPPAVAASIGNNTFRNIAGVGNHTGGFGYAPLQFGGANSDSSTSTFQNIRTWNSNGTPGTAVFSVATAPYYYTCAEAAAAPTYFGAITNCSYGDPGFVAASTSYYNSPASFDLRPAVGSPLINNALVLYPDYDVAGNPRSMAIPSIGAYEYQGAPSPSVSPTSLPAGTVGAAYSQTLTASNFAGAVTWSLLSGSLPTGLSGCTSGTGATCSITGTPSTTSGSPFSFTIRAGDGTTNVDTAYSVTVNPSGGGSGGSRSGGKVTHGGKIIH